MYLNNDFVVLYVNTDNKSCVIRNYDGKLSDIRLWKSVLSASKLKQHTLNPTSIVGNNINSMTSDLVYRFKLNENYPSASLTSSMLVDSNPNNIKDYSREFGNEVYNSTYITKIIANTHMLFKTKHKDNIKKCTIKLNEATKIEIA